MKHIVFVNPPANMHDRYGSLAGAGSTMPSLGLAWLAAACRKGGYDPAIIEAASGRCSHDAVVDQVLSSGARFVGVTAMTSGIDSAALLARKIKERDPAIRVLIGGPHVTVLPEETMRAFTGFDVGFLGEAEGSLVEFLGSADAGLEMARIGGIVFREGGSIRKTESRPFIEDLDRLPLPAWDLIPGFPDRFKPAAIRSKRLPAAHVVTSRGCPMKCTFCDRSVFGTRYRLFSVDYIWEMLETLTGRFGVREILFEDDSFTLHKSRVISLCEKMCSSKKRFVWSCLGRVDTIDGELLRLMKKAGCWQIGFGIESGNPDVLKSVDKRISLDRIRSALAQTRSAGIHTKGFFILGLPQDTIETVRETIRFANSAALDDISVSFATPFPGTVFYEQAVRQGFKPEWCRMNLLNPVYAPPGISPRELQVHHAVFLRRFYLRPGVMADYVIRSLADGRVFLRIILGFLAFLGAVIRKPSSE